MSEPVTGQCYPNCKVCASLAELKRDEAATTGPLPVPSGLLDPERAELEAFRAQRDSTDLCAGRVVGIDLDHVDGPCFTVRCQADEVDLRAITGLLRKPSEVGVTVPATLFHKEKV